MFATSDGMKERHYLRISLGQKDPVLVERLQQMFGVGHITYQKKRPGTSEIYLWACQGRVAFYVASLLWPWLGERKKADFKRALKLVKDTRTEGMSYRGRPVVFQHGGGVFPSLNIA